MKNEDDEVHEDDIGREEWSLSPNGERAHFCVRFAPHQFLLRASEQNGGGQLGVKTRMCAKPTPRQAGKSLSLNGEHPANPNNIAKANLVLLLPGWRRYLVGQYCLWSTSRLSKLCVSSAVIKQTAPGPSAVPIDVALEPGAQAPGRKLHCFSKLGNTPLPPPNVRLQKIIPGRTDIQANSAGSKRTLS